MALVFVLFSALLIKHFIADFVLQPKWMLAGKGQLTAPGGYAHAGLHGISSSVILIACGIAAPLAATVAAVEFVVHYTIDFAKDRISEHAQAERSPQVFWQLHGLDQLAHQMTYVVITWVAVTSLG